MSMCFFLLVPEAEGVYEGAYVFVVAYYTMDIALLSIMYRKVIPDVSVDSQMVRVERVYAMAEHKCAM